MRDGNPLTKAMPLGELGSGVLEVTMRDGNLSLLLFLLLYDFPQGFRSDYEGWKLTLLVPWYFEPSMF